MCQRAGITYDTGKHRYSDAPVELKNKPRMQVSATELLEMPSRVHLDFVCFDIETSNLNADFSILLSACIKPYGQDAIVFRADDYPTWADNRDDDAGITRDISIELRKHAIVVGHYSQRFDIPYFRAKMMKHGLEPLPPMFGIDTWRIAKNNFKVSSRRLDNLLNYFDLGAKHGVTGRLWMKAAYTNSREAMNEIVEHNIADVVLLEKLMCRSFPYVRSIPRL